MVRLVFMAVLLAIILATSTAKALDAVRPIPVVDNVDLIEVNHFYDAEGKLVFDQLIYYDWNRVIFSGEKRRGNRCGWDFQSQTAQLSLEAMKS